MTIFKETFKISSRPNTGFVVGRVFKFEAICRTTTSVARRVMERYLQKFIPVLLGILWIGASSVQGQTTAVDDLLKDVNGEELQELIKSYEGEKAVLINIWATWCAPCIEEFPEIVKIQRKYEDDLRVIFISADFPEGRERALEFLKKQKVDWTTYFKTGKDEAFIKAISKDWSGALPFTKIINKKGEVVSYWENSASFSKFDKHVNKAITP